jgi:hypothetical protein
MTLILTAILLETANEMITGSSHWKPRSDQAKCSICPCCKAEEPEGSAVDILFSSELRQISEALRQFGHTRPAVPRIGAEARFKIWISPAGIGGKHRSRDPLRW